MAKFVFYHRGEVELVDQRRDVLPDGGDPKDPVANAKCPLSHVHVAERILWIDAAGGVWVVKDRFEFGELPRLIL